MASINFKCRYILVNALEFAYFYPSQKFHKNGKKYLKEIAVIQAARMHKYLSFKVLKTINMLLGSQYHSSTLKNIMSTQNN